VLHADRQHGARINREDLPTKYIPGRVQREMIPAEMWGGGWRLSLHESFAIFVACAHFSLCRFLLSYTETYTTPNT
jgi:hypothetical protein